MPENPIAAALRQLADQLEEAPQGGVAPEELPSAPWESIRARALGKSLAALRVEAIHAVAALHAAHSAASAVLAGRAVLAFAAARQGHPSDPARTSEEHSAWLRDEVALQAALRVLAELDVPAATLGEALELDREEARLTRKVVAGVETAITRALLEEQEEP